MRVAYRGCAVGCTDGLPKNPDIKLAKIGVSPAKMIKMGREHVSKPTEIWIDTISWRDSEGFLRTGIMIATEDEERGAFAGIPSRFFC